ncbi:MAG: thioesterase family protein [Candidatus Omnitrophica bacterium]|nr:thioesterase family protein [Candidatus Omnitrophota bacterium]
MKVRIYYHDTDCGGVVYYANYLKYLEEARSEYFEERGLIIKDMLRDGIGFVVARQEIDYKLPSFYGDILEVKTRVTDASLTRVNFEYDIVKDSGQLVASAKTVIVFVDASAGSASTLSSCRRVDKALKPRRIPEDILNKLTVKT